MELLEQLNRVNIQMTELKSRIGKLTVSEIWRLSDLEDERDDILYLMNEQELDYKIMEKE